jgi:5-methylcytosine-specific restriction endonuclease McrA
MPVDEERLEEVRGNIETADRRDDFLGLYMVLLQANRQSWPDTWIEKAERAHAAFVRTQHEMSRAWQRSADAVPGSPEEGAAKEDLEAASRHFRTALRSWRLARQPERAKRRRIPPKVRRELIDEWEAGGRICGLCHHPVAENDRIEVHHWVPTAEGGTSEKANLAVTHQRCNNEFGDGTVVHMRDRERSLARRAAGLPGGNGQ